MWQKIHVCTRITKHTHNQIVLPLNTCRLIISETLGAIEFNFYHRWFDVIFLVSSITAIVVHWIAHVNIGYKATGQMLKGDASFKEPLALRID